MNMVGRENIKINNSRSKSATGLRNMTTVKSRIPTENGKQSGAIRSVGPVTRSLARAFLTQTGSRTMPPSSSCNKTVTTTIPAKDNANPIARGTSVRPTFGTSKVTVPVHHLADNARLPPSSPLPPKTSFNLLTRQSRPFNALNKIAARLTPSKTKAKQENVASSKDSVISDETDIQWVAGHDYEFSENSIIFPATKRDTKRDLSCSYLRVSQVLNGYGRRSKTQDISELNRVYKEISNNSANNNQNRMTCQSAKCSPIPGPTMGSGVAQSQSSSEVSDNGFCEGRNELDDCSLYSFVVPYFSEPATDGVGYRKLMDLILTTFNSHLKKCDTLLENQTNLPDSVAESIRVAVGRTQLLMRKRLTQFNQQLERHLNPIPSEKETTLNDLHGLWSLIDIQLSDIRLCFDDIEASRLSDWQAPAEKKPALTTASSMPSLRITEKENKTNLKMAVIHKNSAEEPALKDKENLAREKSLAAAKKRQDEIRRRQEFIRTKRAEMVAATKATGQSDDSLEVNSATTSLMMVVP